MLHYSKAESDRFGYRIFRGNLDGIQPDQLPSILVQQNIEIAIVRLPVESINVLQQIQKNNIHCILADTLLYYTVQPKVTEFETKYGMNIIVSQDYHSEILNHLVLDIFSNYKNHYSSNVLLNTQLLAPGYFQWIENICNSNLGKCWLLKYKEQYVGFIVCKFIDNVCEIILNGVLPTFANRGIYTFGLKHVINYCAHNHYRSILVSTQIDNFKVQQIWQNINFKLSHGFYTLHLLSNEISVKYNTMQ